MTRASILAILALVSAAPAPAQERGPAPTTRATTLAALTTYPLFFNRQRVRVQGELAADAGVDALWLADGARRIFLVDPLNRAHGPGSRLEAMGTFWDVGRAQPDDPRLPTFDFRALSRSVLNRDWPGPGELLVLLAESVAPFEPEPEPTLRTVALDPSACEGKRVTVVGRFRGANLYGDLPAAASKSKWDFVVQAADAAVWITGLQPKGKGFLLDPQARVDTGRWLRISGVVRHDGAIVWIEGQEIQSTDKPAEPESAAAEVQRIVLTTPPVVVFSAPVQDDTDVESRTEVRIQFSRDMTPASFKDRVKASYLGGAPDAPPPPAFTFAYRQAQRMLEIQFSAPLERFRTVRVELLDGITSIDALNLGPWTLSFSVGGR